MTSRRGYSLGARTAPKITPHGGPHWVYPIGVTETPAPETYQKDNTALRRFKNNRHPFAAASKRFGKTVAEPDLPGPGAYDHNIERNKHVQLAGKRHMNIVTIIYSVNHSTRAANEKKRGGEP